VYLLQLKVSFPSILFVSALIVSSKLQSSELQSSELHVRVPRLKFRTPYTPEEENGD